ncbi:hypothetical protein BpHYR1_049354, partial [Brachionus plicatilis]
KKLSIMPKRVFKLPVSLEINRLNHFYSQIIEKMIDVEENQKLNFFNLVIPSLAEPVIISDISDNPRFVCNFLECKEENKSFASKQKFIQHLKIFHDQELPGACSFLYPNDKATIPGGFWCSDCGHHYCRRDHLQNHFKTSTHCKNATISSTNPLELREIEIEKMFAIEDGSLQKNHDFKFNSLQYESLLSIEWKPTEKKPEEIDSKKPENDVNAVKTCFKKLAKSFSMISIAKKKSNNFKQKSKTCDNIFSLVDISFKKTNTNMEIKNECTDLKRKKPNDFFDESFIKKKNFSMNEKIIDDEDQILIDSLNYFESLNKKKI